VTVSPRTIFDQSSYLSLIEARGETIRRAVNQLTPTLNLSTALDAGCGIGFFSEILRECGLQVSAFDGRIQNVEEARRRFPQTSFEQGDIQTTEICKLGEFDLVLCFGLLYHLENPLLAIRNLHALTRKALLLESMCFPEQEPWMLLREEMSFEDQGLTDIAFCPSEGCLAKMLYRGGFSQVYRIEPLPDHEDFRDTQGHMRRRTVLLASYEPLSLPGFTLLPEPLVTQDPWNKANSNRTLFRRVRDFLHYSRRNKTLAIAVRWRKWFPRIPYPFQLPSGSWWLAKDSKMDEFLLWHGGYWQEEAQMHFVERFLRPGMTALDVGAHHGLYTLLASKLVRPRGRVIAFEPSPRERKRLREHVWLNFCMNTTVEPYALGDQKTQADFFVVEDLSEDWCNSLRPPVVRSGTRVIKVDVLRLDDYLMQTGLESVDFLKLDAEGAELSVLRGAQKMLQSVKRPVIMVEVEDRRTKPWGYRASEIVTTLDAMGYEWFQPLSDGSLTEIGSARGDFEANLVAIPTERKEQVYSPLRQRC
jgi:tRNA (mo5U34)-methyltransferase